MGGQGKIRRDIARPFAPLQHSVVFNERVYAAVMHPDDAFELGDDRCQPFG